MDAWLDQERNDLSSGLESWKKFYEKARKLGLKDKEVRAKVRKVSPPYKHPPKLAAGGFVRDGVLAVVGEAGPEAIIPLSGGQIHVHYGGTVYGDKSVFARRLALLARAELART